MQKQVEKPKENKNQPAANAVAQRKNNGNQTFALEDNRMGLIVQKKLKTIENNSDVAQLGKKKRDAKIAKKNNPNGIQHHIRPEYQSINEKQMEIINSGVNISKKDAKRQAKEEAKSK